jgi:sialate O-acetylesterase
MVITKNAFSTLMLIGIFLIQTSASFAQVRLNNLFTDNMVLQQQSSVPVWGWAQPGEKVVVKVSWTPQAQVAATADQNGKWKVLISTPQAGGPYTFTVKGKDDLLTVKNVMAGEVWLCSGQSNMWLPLRRCDDAQAEIQKADYPNIRFFTVGQVTSDTPQENCSGKWEVCSPDTAKEFSATAYYFGRELHMKLNVPVGLIHASWGGAPADSWTSEKTLRSDPQLTKIFTVWKGWEDAYETVNKEYEIKIEQWRNAKKKNQEGSELVKEPDVPDAVYNITRPYRKPAVLYNAMICPLIPYTIKGAIWNQGSANRERAYQYDRLFASMIRNWRSDWGLGDFPFYFVQLAPFNYSTKPFGAAEIREAQLKTHKMVDNTGIVVTMDAGDPNDIHPTKKKIVGVRLSLWALAKTYGFKEVLYSGPVYKSMKIDQDKVSLSFDFTGSGLSAKDGPLTHFVIAGEDRVFFPAAAEIDGNNIIISSGDVKKPAAVRYAWTAGEIPNLFNKEGFPASPFRTDDWPKSTEPVEGSKRQYQVYVKKDIPYLEKGRAEKLDLYYPADADKQERFPGVVIIHGGGWVDGDKAKNREKNIGGTLARAGYVCISINYKLLDDNTNWQQIVYDCKNAVRFLRANAQKYQVDPDHIGAIGGSAGGHLSLMLAFTAGQKEFEPETLYPGVSSRIQAVVDMYGKTNLLTSPNVDENGRPLDTLKDTTTSKFIGGSREEKPQLWKLLSPVNHISKDDPPVLIFHGTKDTTICYTQSEELAQKLKEADHPYELHMLKDIGHTFDLERWNNKPLPEDLRPIVIDFFDQYLKPKENGKF